MIVMQRFSPHLISKVFFITCLTAAFYSEAADQNPNSSMQLPSWVESIGESPKKQITEKSPEEAVVPVSQPSFQVKSSSKSNDLSKKTTPATLSKSTKTTPSK